MVDTSPASALEIIRREPPDVILLHPSLEDANLAGFILEVRKVSNVTLMVLADQANEYEVVTAREAGADDYVRLPCDLLEIMIRSMSYKQGSYGTIRACLRLIELFPLTPTAKDMACS